MQPRRIHLLILLSERVGVYEKGFYDPYFRAYDQAYPDLWRFNGWNREFQQFVAAQSAVTRNREVDVAVVVWMTPVEKGSVIGLAIGSMGRNVLGGNLSVNGVSP